MDGSQPEIDPRLTHNKVRQLERQRARRRGRHDVDVEVRPLARYDQLIPA